MVDTDTILVNKADGIARITINRPEARNAKTWAMTRRLVDITTELASDRDTRVVVVTGAGTAFCAGKDLKEGTPTTGAKPVASAEEIRNDLSFYQQTCYLLHSMEKPTIAAVNGDAVGGGMDLALACDIRLGCERTRFKVAFTDIGLVPGVGGIWLLSRIVGPAKAAELLFTDQFVLAEEAYRLGMLNHLVPSDELQERTMALARKIASAAPTAIRLAKMQLLEGWHMDYKSALKLAAVCETIALASEDHREAVAAFREKRLPNFRGG